jgi:chromosome segregation ATPase
LASIDRLSKAHGLTGVYGPVFELFEYDERFETAIEVAAGGR